MPSVHILGICGTFMGGIAAIAAEAGYAVSGCDANVYPPMSDQLSALGIELTDGFGAGQLAIAPDCWVIGNVVSRGNPLMEAILDSGQRYVSGPQWLFEQVLHKRQVIAVAGTHGKTTTTAMLRHILITCGHDAGYLVGGVPADGAPSAALGSDKRFVIEADEYDTAFFDKRSKFVHYRPHVAILNNLEFDHADIFDDLAQIQTQFHHLVRTIAQSGSIVRPAQSPALDQVLARGVWSPVRTVTDTADNADWAISDLRSDAHTSEFDVSFNNSPVGRCELAMAGSHNRLNALAAIAAAHASGVDARAAVAAIATFAGVKRRLEVRGVENDVTVIDDFAHHPTAIELTIAALRERMTSPTGKQSEPPQGRILAVLEPRSNTMRAGRLNAQLADSVRRADRIYCLSDSLDWDVNDVFAPLAGRFASATDIDQLVAHIAKDARPGDTVLVMSNGGFGGIHDKLLDALRRAASVPGALNTL